jgi:hypothetical protein
MGLEADAAAVVDPEFRVHVAMNFLCDWQTFQFTRKLFSEVGQW